MKTRDVIGQRIVAVSQGPVKTNYGKRVFRVEHLELENGLLLVPEVSDMEDDSFVELQVFDPETKEWVG